MAKYKRMINCDFVNASSFKLKISNKAKLLYFFIITNSDDWGFVDNTDELVELLDSNDRKFHNEASLDLVPYNYSTALSELLEKSLLFEFEDKHHNKIYLIKHWYAHNVIPKARIRDSAYQKYLEKVEINDEGEYVVNQVISSCKANDNQVIAQSKVNKSKEKESKVNEYEEINNTPIECDEEDDYNIPIVWDFEHSSKAVKLLVIEKQGKNLTEKQKKYLESYKQAYENVDINNNGLSNNASNQSTSEIEDDDLPF